MPDPLLIALTLLCLAILVRLIAWMWRGEPTAMTEEEVKKPEEWK